MFNEGAAPENPPVPRVFVPLYFMPPLIELHNVRKVFKTTAGEYIALKNIDLTFEQGEFTAIMGKSGSGKSTLINMITGIDHPSAGSVRVGETTIHRMNEGQLAEWRGRTLGIVFQFFQLLPTLTVLENTMLPMDYCDRYDPGEREDKAMSLLAMLELEEMADKLPAALSGGQQQIAAIARALANDPPLLIADEPTGNLDSRTAQRVLEIFEVLACQGKTILIVTHDPTLAQRAGRRVLISDGELINEQIAQAMPILSHGQMLQLTHLVAPRHYEAGATIARQGALEAGLYIITHGEVEILRQSGKNQSEVIGVIQAGQYFSNLELLETEACNLTFRAVAQAPVETLCLTLTQFTQWLSENPTAESALRQAAVQHSQNYCPGEQTPATRRKSPITRLLRATSTRRPS
jgi:ABC-type lipoprotein export system ATPase subunit